MVKGIIKHTFLTGLLLISILFWMSCEDRTESKNEPPVISSLIAEPDTVETGGVSEITCNASDEDSDTLTYIWTTPDGSISGNESTVTYTAPNTEGTFTITCVVFDENSGSDWETIDIFVHPSTVTDIDGNIYQTVRIGGQWWMAENLKVTHYRNGDSIATGFTNSEWTDLSTGAYAIYNDDSSNTDTYGNLYNWYAADDNRNIAPTGWHVPTDEEWQELEMYIGMSPSEADQTGWRGIDEGGKMKESGTDHWNSPNTGASNESGFTGLPGSYRGDDGGYGHQGIDGYFWSSTEYWNDLAWGRQLGCYNQVIYRDILGKQAGFSIRCVRDQTRTGFTYRLDGFRCVLNGQPNVG